MQARTSMLRFLVATALAIGGIAPAAMAQLGTTTLGTGACAELTTGDRNTCVGEDAGTSTTIDHDGTFIGFNAGYNNDGTDNTIIGSQAGYSNTSGFDGTFIGARAGYYNTATDNTFVGATAGYYNTSGDDLTFIGEQAGYYNTTGRDNTFVGEDAGYFNTVGDRNTFVGNEAGYRNPEGDDNTAIGWEAGYDLGIILGISSAASGNTYVGSAAGRDGGDANDNTMIGFQAGYHNEYGDENTFLGKDAGYENGRLNNEDEGHGNTYLGFFAGAELRRGDRNVFIGHSAGPSSSSTRSTTDSIILGANAGPSGTTARSYAVVIGTDASYNCSNCMVLGGTTEASRVSVGVGTNAPDQDASLELDESDRGFLVNRLTNAERAALAANLEANDEGMMVYDLEDQALYTWDAGETQWVPVDSDAQSLAGASLSGTTLQIDIESGSSASVDLASLQDGTGSDDQTLSLISDVLMIESGNFVSLADFLDNTDDQNLTGASLTGTVLQIDIEDGSSAGVDLAALQDGTGTDDQNLTGASLSGTVLLIDIENGSSAAVDLSELSETGGFSSVYTVQAGARDIGVCRRDYYWGRRVCGDVTHGAAGEAHAGAIALRAGAILGFSVATDEPITYGKAEFAVAVNGVAVEGASNTIVVNKNSGSGYREFSPPIGVLAGDELSFELASRHLHPGLTDATLTMWVRW